MKNFILIFILLTTILSCTSNQNKRINEKPKKTKEIKPNFASFMEGEWVLSSYIKSIENTLSPIKSADKLKGIVTLIIPKTNNRDTIEIGASWNNHEGYSFRTFLEQGKENNSLKTDLPDYDNESNHYDLGYEIIDSRVFLFLYHYNSSNKLLDKIKFTKVKVTKSENDASDGLQQIVNEKIFAGKYLLFDSTNTPLKVSFNSDGKISGHSDFKTYYVFTDFMGGPEPIVDEMMINFRTEKSKGFLFKAKKDTIFLYHTKGDGMPGGEPLSFGELKYKLVRK